MKRSNFLSLLLPALLLASAVSGCKKTPVTITPIPGTGQVGPERPGNMITPGGTLPGGNASGADAQGNQPLSDDRDIPAGFSANRDQFKEQTIYFDYDRAVVKDSEKGKVTGVASFLKNEAATHVQIEGHCDERGTEEYNRALGERRALAIREALSAAGVAADRIHTISYGEDKPAVQGHDEGSWSKNRRGEFILLRPKAGQ